MSDKQLSRRRFLSLAAAATASAMVGRSLGQAVAPTRQAQLPTDGSASRPARPPNVVLILADDLGWRDTGFMGSRFYRTPNVDALASRGVTFTQAYTNAPNCAPSRASLLTGLYPPRHGIYTVGSAERGDAKDRKLVPVVNKRTLALGFVTLAERLREGGYATAHIGKWHLGEAESHYPTAQGFDVNIAGTYRGMPRSYFGPYDELPGLQGAPKDEYLTDRLTDEAVKFMKSHRDQPFFLYLSHFAVHTPIQSREKDAAPYRDLPPVDGQHNAEYAGMIAALDRGVGRLTDALDRLGLRDDTIVVFFSDNGGLGGYEAAGVKHKDVTSNAPLRGGKGMLYEGGIRVPLAVSWPGRVEGGRRLEEPVIGSDLMRTLLALTGVGLGSVETDGADLSGLLTGRQRELNRDAIFWHLPAYLEASGGGWRSTPGSAIRMGDWKLIEHFETGRLELYNLATDIGETQDLSSRERDRVAQLHARLRQWREQTGAMIPTELNPQYAPVE